MFVQYSLIHDLVPKVVAIIVENYNEIFPVDISWKQYDEDMDKIIAAVKELPEDDGWGYSKKNSVSTQFDQRDSYSKLLRRS